MTKSEYIYKIVVSQEMILREPHMISHMIEYGVKHLRADGWYVYEIEKVDPKTDPEYYWRYYDIGDLIYFRCKRMKPPKIKLDWCNARLDI